MRDSRRERVVFGPSVEHRAALTSSQSEGLAEVTAEAPHGEHT